MIGYGKADTEVIDIDRRSSDGMLVMQVSTSEADFVHNAGTQGNSRSVVAYDVTNDVYKWWVAFKSVRTDRPHFVYFSPDGTKVLVNMFKNGRRSILYLNAETGARISTPI